MQLDRKSGLCKGNLRLTNINLLYMHLSKRLGRRHTHFSAAARLPTSMSSYLGAFPRRRGGGMGAWMWCCMICGLWSTIWSPAQEKLPKTSMPQDQRGRCAGTVRVLFWRHTWPPLMGLCESADRIFVKPLASVIGSRAKAFMTNWGIVPTIHLNKHFVTVTGKHFADTFRAIFSKGYCIGRARVT